MAEPTTAEVHLHGRPVGTLVYDRGGSSFEYKGDLIAPTHRVLGQTFEDDPRTIRRVRTGLTPWFKNLLPEGELRRQVTRAMGGGRISDYRLLLWLGADLPGAVTVHADAEPDDSGDLTAVDIDAPASAPSDRWSLAGVQLKWSVHSSRLTVPVRGPDGWWIAKLPDRTVSKLAENEYITMRWLGASGFDVPATDLILAKFVPDVPGGFVAPDDLIYLVRRFDRPAEGRTHVEDFAQVADVEPEYKYGQLGSTYDTMGTVVRHLTGDDGFYSYVDRLVAVILTGNTDAHLKNWALWYPDGRKVALAPVYDFHSLTVYQSRFRYAPLALSLAGEHMATSVTVEHFRQLAETSGGDPDAVAERVAKIVSQLRETWFAGIRSVGLKHFPALVEHYDQRLVDLPLARNAVS
jgi:serine/threonine-protein kinase HipA